MVCHPSPQYCTEQIVHSSAITPYMNLWRMAAGPENSKILTLSCLFRPKNRNFTVTGVKIRDGQSGRLWADYGVDYEVDSQKCNWRIIVWESTWLWPTRFSCRFSRRLWRQISDENNQNHNRRKNRGKIDSGVDSTILGRFSFSSILTRFWCKINSRIESRIESIIGL